jgi:hypothetical protein
MNKVHIVSDPARFKQFRDMLSDILAEERNPCEYVFPCPSAGHNIILQHSHAYHLLANVTDMSSHMQNCLNISF